MRSAAQKDGPSKLNPSLVSHDARVSPIDGITQPALKVARGKVNGPIIIWRGSIAHEKLRLTDPKEGSRLYNASCLETQRKSWPNKMRPRLI